MQQADALKRISERSSSKYTKNTENKAENEGPIIYRTDADTGQLSYRRQANTAPIIYWQKRGKRDRLVIVQKRGREQAQHAKAAR